MTPGRISLPRLIDAPGSLRLAVGCCACLILGFVLLAQVNLWHQVGGGTPPGPRAVLLRYHGDPDKTLLHDVLDPARPLSDRRNMSQYLGGAGMDDPVTQERRKQILDWVEAGAPENGWRAVAPIFTAIESCGACCTRSSRAASVGVTRCRAWRPPSRPSVRSATGTLTYTPWSATA